MGLVLNTTFALIVWIVLWAGFGAKSFDGFLVAMTIITLGATAHIVKPYLPGRE
jgi:hypothetical protein